MSRPLFPILAIGSIAILAIACGSPDPSRGFVFTPYPYTVVPTVESCPYCPRAVSVSETCHLFDAELVGVLVEEKKTDDFVRWAEEYDFVIRSVSTPPAALPTSIPRLSSLYVRVPLGAVPDAVKAAAKRPGVTSAESSGFAHFPENPPPPAEEECRRKQSE